MESGCALIQSCGSQTQANFRAVPKDTWVLVTSTVTGPSDSMSCRTAWMASSPLSPAMKREAARQAKPQCVINRCAHVALDNEIKNARSIFTSDCHAWSASPNYDLLATVCGIEPTAPGFKSVRIEPNLGELKWLRASMPHPLGMITIMLEKHDALLEGQVELPPGLEGFFFYAGAKKKLDSGVNAIRMGNPR